MIKRAVLVWCIVLLLAIANGGLREAVLIPRWGDPVGRAVSTLILCGLIVLMCWSTIGWIRPRSSTDALR